MAAKPRRPKARLEVDERRAQLLALGLGHFGKKTYDEVSIDDIAEAAKISKGLLYHYFPTKRAFYAATVREAARMLVEACEASAGDGDRPPLEQLALGLDAYLTFADEHGAAYLGLMASGVGVDPEIGGIVEEARVALLGRLTEGVEQIVGARKPLTEIALRGWIGFVENATLAWLKEKKHAKSRAQLRDLCVSSLVAILQIQL